MTYDSSPPQPGAMGDKLPFLADSAAFCALLLGSNGKGALLRAGGAIYN